MTSYQTLKEKNRKLQAEIQKLLDEPEYYISQNLANNVRRGIMEACLFGKHYMLHKPSGKVKFTGIIKKLTESGR